MKGGKSSPEITIRGSNYFQKNLEKITDLLAILVDRHPTSATTIPIDHCLISQLTILLTNHLVNQPSYHLVDCIVDCTTSQPINWFYLEDLEVCLTKRTKVSNINL